MYANSRSHNEKIPRGWVEVNSRSPEIAATMALDMRPNVMWNPSNLPENTTHSINRIRNERIKVIRNRLGRKVLEGFSSEVGGRTVGWESFSNLLLHIRIKSATKCHITQPNKILSTIFVEAARKADFDIQAVHRLYTYPRLFNCPNFLKNDRLLCSGDLSSISLFRVFIKQMHSVHVKDEFHGHLRFYAGFRINTGCNRWSGAEEFSF